MTSGLHASSIAGGCRGRDHPAGLPDVRPVLLRSRGIDFMPAAYRQDAGMRLAVRLMRGAGVAEVRAGALRVSTAICAG
jgi:hypothetical protein